MTENEELFQSSEHVSSAFDRLIQVLKILRSPGGCPWDRKQTINPFYKNLIEESYEYIDAVTYKEPHDAHEELGDVFLVASMLGIMHEEADHISLTEILDSVSEKLIRRHPHVFADAAAENPDAVVELWDSIKENIEGRKSQDSIFSHITHSLPPLDKAQEIQKKAAKNGFDWDQMQLVLEKMQEEIGELQEALQNNRTDQIEEEIGDLLFTAVNISRFAGIQASIALHKSSNKFMKRFNAMQKQLSEKHIELQKDNMKAMETAWNEVKDQEVR